MFMNKDTNILAHMLEYCNEIEADCNGRGQ